MNWKLTLTRKIKYHIFYNLSQNNLFEDFVPHTKFDNIFSRNLSIIRKEVCASNNIERYFKKSDHLSSAFNLMTEAKFQSVNIILNFTTNKKYVFLSLIFVKGIKSQLLL